MQTPILSPAQRSYMRDPEGFRARMADRAADLYGDGYTANAGMEPGVWLMETPKGDVYTVDAINEMCTCPYQQKGEIPQVPCKHLMGLEALVEARIEFWTWRASVADKTAGPTNFSAERAAEYRQIAAVLSDHWQETVAEVQLRGYDANEADADVCASDRADKLCEVR